MSGRLVVQAAAMVGLSLQWAGAQVAPTPESIIEYAAQSGESTWRKLQDPGRGYSSRELYTYALALCEAGQHPDRLAPLFRAGTAMQDRDPESRGYGNFLWKTGDPQVLDYNAVEFCMQAGAIIWLRHKNTLPDEARAVLEESLPFAVDGCLRHRVNASYTNIALMNAENLILLGEGMGQPEVADEGYLRLDRICLYTHEAGIHEYGSPTYLGVDLDCLVLVEALCERDRGREQARALLELLWTGIALNWFPASQRLAGTRSRDYDYLTGKGFLDTQLWANGWLAGEPRGGASSVYPALANWHPPESLRDYQQAPFPRAVRASWGVTEAQAKTHFMLPEVTLSSSGANYGPMDFPLTVDLPGDRDTPRCIFVPDARQDPYGKARYETGGGHLKAHHLRPFFTAAQREGDALGLVVYRDGDLPEEFPTLETHFVMPLAVDEVHVGGRRLEFVGGTAASYALAAGEALVLRLGTAAVGVRVPFSRGLDGASAPASVIYDGNQFGVFRLTVSHGSDAVVRGVLPAGAALWVRARSGVEGSRELDAFRREFAAAACRATATDGAIAIRVDADGGPVAVEVDDPNAGSPRLEPAPTRAILELDGEDIGGPLLTGVEPMASLGRYYETAEPISVPAGGDVRFEAEEGALRPLMRESADPGAGGGRFVWMAGEEGAGGGDPLSSATWLLSVEEEGDYYLWARILTPTPDDDSFFVGVTSEGRDVVALAEWHTGVHRQWEWTPVRLSRTTEPTALRLPAGEVELQFRVREDGAMLDRLWITRDPTARPE